MPVIVFGDYLLRTITKHDYLDMYEYGSDDEVTKFLTWGPFQYPYQAKKAIKSIFYPRTRKGLPRGYAIVDQKENKMIGTIDFHSKKKDENGAEIGYVIHKDYWNKGIVTQALRELIKIGFDYLHYDIIHIKHAKHNLASARVIEKNGFQKIGTELYAYEKNQVLIEEEIIVYAYTKERYYANQQS